MARHLDHQESIVQQIQAGDRDLRERFIADSIPFIKGAVRRVTHAYFIDQDDEFSLALEAFDAAISHFKSDQNVPFEPYALLLIKNRILNWIRSQQKHPPTVSLSEQETEDGLALDERLADPHSGQIQENLEFEDDMARVEAQLSLFGFTMLDLADKLPRHQDSRRLCIRIARQLSAADPLYQNMLQRRRLPCAELARLSGTPLKTVEKNRATIILLALLIRSDLQVIHTYLAAFTREESI